MTDQERIEKRQRSEKLLAECLQPMKEHGHVVALACFGIIDLGDGSYARSIYTFAEPGAPRIVLGQFVRDAVDGPPKEFVPYTPTVPTSGGKPS